MSDVINLPNEHQKEPQAQLAAWKKIIFALALGIGLAGVALYALSFFTDTPAPVEAQQGNTFRAQSFDSFDSSQKLKQSWPAIEQAPLATSSNLQLTDWSTLLMKLGFSFVVGFSIGYAISGFLKVALFVSGAAFLLLFGLQYAGLIDVNWQGMSGAYDGFVTWLQPHMGNFKEFISSQLPASGTATAGLLMSLKR